jgi:hypothetical protein
VWPFVWPLLLILLAVLLVGNVINLINYWLAGRRGLDQWPDAHGRYYDEWLSLPDGAGDYYEWLAQRMGSREPWLTWARKERELGSSK